MSFVRVMLDGRAAERYAIRLPVVVMGETEAEATEATVRDINWQGGIFLFTRNYSAASQEMKFSITVPEQWTPRENVRVECKATVVRLERDADDALVGVAAKITGFNLTGSKKPEV